MSITKFYLYSLLLLLVIALSASCIVKIVDYSDPRGLIPIEDYYRNIRFSPGGVVSLRNFDGIVEITGWDRNELDIYAEKMIPRSEETQIRFRMTEKDIAQIDMERYGDENVSINTKSASEEGEDTVVDYYIKTPRHINIQDVLARYGDIFIADIYGSVSVKLEQGNIDVDNFSGSMDASVIKGSVQACLYDVREEDVISVHVQEGDITLFLEKSISASIKAYFPEGEFSSEFDLTETKEKEKEIDMKLGSGGASIYLTALNGHISIKIIEPDQTDMASPLYSSAE
jgi:hypothetical protein